MKAPGLPQAVEWRNGLVLAPEHFQRSDERAAQLARMAALGADPWPWGFTQCDIDETALAAGTLRITVEAVFPDGTIATRRTLTRALPDASAQAMLGFALRVPEDGNAAEAELIAAGADMAEMAPGARTLPAARLTAHAGVWGPTPQWSPPTLLVGEGHPLREDATLAVSALAALGAGFLATLRMPGAEERAAARRLSQVALELISGVGVLDFLLSAPIVSPGRLGMEAVRLALGVRAAAGVFEPLGHAWDPGDQRGSLRRILHAAEATAAQLGLPFRTVVFRHDPDTRLYTATGLPPGKILLGVEAARPADLGAACTWLEGAAIAAPDRIGEALTRRVGGCARHPVQRDARIGVSSGPLLALYQIDDDMAWRAGERTLALGTRSSDPPREVSVLAFVPEEERSADSAQAPLPSARGRSAPEWAGGGDA